jgi:hypothetical protein
MNKLLELARTKLGAGYIWSAQGQVLTEKLLKDFISWHGESHYLFTDSQGTVNARKWLGKQCFDCSGLVLWCLQELGVMNKKDDYDAATFYHKWCNPITLSSLLPGDLVFRRNSVAQIVHIGIYNGGNTVVEAKGTRYGVVIGDIKDFNLYGRLKFNLEENKMRRGLQSQEVINLQEKLRKIGYEVIADGKFGPETETAVLNFQLHNDLTPDGIVGESTIKKLDEMITRLEPNKALTWEEIIDKKTDRPEDWKKAIKYIMAKAESSEEIEICKYFPTFIEKMHKS